MQDQPSPEGDSAGHTVALRQSEERFRLLVESVADYAIYILGPTGIVQSWNTGAQRLKGYRPEEILGKHYSVFYTDEYRDAGLPDRLLQTALRDGRAKHSGWRVRKDGSHFWADVVITALYDDGRHTGFAKVTRDMTEAHLAAEARERALTEQQQAVSRLEDLDRWRRDFIGTVVHDLQTPIVGIGGFLDLLASGDVPEELKDDVHERLRSNVRTLQELVTNLRDYALLSDGRVVLRPEPIPLRGFVAELVADMAPVLSAHEVRSEVDDLSLVADRQGLERILRNLLANGARHTPAGTRISIRVTEQDEDVTVEVSDNGPGIPPELLERVLDRFERGARGGTGLGLAIARQFAELHGGELDVTSVPGEGAAFRFTLPQTGDRRDRLIGGARDR